MQAFLQSSVQLTGGGDGSTTFNQPDKTGRVSAMKETLAARLTSTYFGGASTAIGVTGSSSEKVTMNRSDMPNVALGVTGAISVLSTVTNIIKAGLVSAGYVTGGGGPVYWNNGTDTSGQVTSTRAANLTSASINGNATQTSMLNVQPTIICNYIMRVI